MKRKTYRIVGLLLGAMLGWYAAGTGFFAETVPVAHAQTHEAGAHAPVTTEHDHASHADQAHAADAETSHDGHAEHGAGEAEGHGEHGAHGEHPNLAQELTPVHEDYQWYRPVLRVLIALFALGALVGLIKLRLPFTDPGIAAGEEDKQAAHHDDHGHDEHAHGDDHGHKSNGH